MSLVCRSISLPSPEATTELAGQIAGQAGAGDVLLLEGGIGAGKTHFARGFIQALLAEPEDIPSPTFTLVQVYDAPDCEIWHADLYRLGSPDEVVELGLTEAFETGICLVEWPDRLAELVPDDALHLSFSIGETEGCRTLTLKTTHPGWAKRIEDLSP